VWIYKVSAGLLIDFEVNEFEMNMNNVMTKKNLHNIVASPAIFAVSA
jgi:hypothetical protein